MKNIFKIAIICCCITAISCDDFLTKMPNNSLSINDSYNTSEDIQMAVNGCYNGLIGVKRASEILFNENRSDNATYPNTENISSNYEAFAPAILMVPVSSDYVTPYWKACYTLIGRINLVLKHLDVVTNAKLHTQFEAEVKFMRGWCYFNLVRYFGGVPIISAPINTSSEAQKIARSSAEQTYLQIEEDLTQAYKLLEGLGSAYKPDYGEVNQWAAKALLAKMYMTLGKNDSALPLLEDVYKNSKFKLTNNYEDLFTSATESIFCKEEVLFAIRFTGGNLGVGNTSSTLCAHVDISKYGSNLAYWSNSLRTAFLTTSDSLLDRRYDVTCAEVPGTEIPKLDGELKRYPPKVVGLTKDGEKYTTAKLSNKNDGDLDCADLRFADVVLLLAELKGQAEGLPLLNSVRFRAGAPELTSQDVIDKFGGDFRLAVLNERRLEFAFENQRFFDMLRFGEKYTTDKLLEFFKTETAYDANIYPNVYVLLSQVIYGDKIESWRLLLPIPNDEILRNSLIEQNPGYGK